MENTKARSHRTFSLLKDVMVRALRSCAELNLRKAPCNALVSVLDGIILYMGGAVRTQEDESYVASKSMPLPSHFHVYNGVVGAVVK